MGNEKDAGNLWSEGIFTHEKWKLQVYRLKKVLPKRLYP